MRQYVSPEGQELGRPAICYNPPGLAPARILMLAPEPFFEPRGTPFSEYHRIKALGELGYHVDLVTYPFGLDVDLPNLRIFRCWRPPFVQRVRIGPSLTKLVLDVVLAAKAMTVARATRYDAIHSHEEAGLLGVWLARRHGIPHLYDMHSSLPQQLANFRYTGSRGAQRLFDRVETAMVDGSRVVITICRELQDAVVEAGAGDRSFLIENVMGGDVDDSAGEVDDDAQIRSRYGIDASQPLVLYTGTLEPYQGLDLLIDASARLVHTHPNARILVVGGEARQVDATRDRARGRADNMVFAGQRPATEIPAFVAAADVLVSPRIAGTNTPLKIYSYLRSGRPIVATNLRTHTQVLNDQTALLVPPDPASFAEAVGLVIDRPDIGGWLSEAAKLLAATRYSREAYLAKTTAAYERLLHGPDAESQSSASPVQRSKVS